MNAQEVYKTEREMEDELTEQYGTITIAGLEFDSGRILRELDVPFFDGCIAESLQWQCDNCKEVYEEQDEAEECCKEVFTCEVCGEEYEDEDDAITCCEEETNEEE